MQVGMAVNTLGYIADNIKGWDRPTRLGVYGTFAEIEKFLHSLVQDKQWNVKTLEELRRYRHSLGALGGLGTGNGHDEVQHISWMIAAVSALRTDMCLGQHLSEPE